MTTDFNNKYLQVLQNYDEFGEYSADYVKGEDHVAFLIEENEVIYWLYLEQVWRPLNVRTTKTGELEDGRTKVAVKLEYVEGGQKYTSVPNIPDPERITSMSHFLEDYPDIEEVNVSGTVNLTDLSYAFAGSKIKDFSMLDTSNVDDMTYCLSNIDNNELEVITYSNVTCCISHILDNSTIKSFTYNGTVTDDSYFNNVTAEKLIVNTEQEITELNRALMRISNGCDISYIKGLNIQLSEAYGVNTLELVEAKEISYDYNGSSYNNFKVKCDSFDLYPRKNNINICNQIDVTEVTILNIFNTAQAKFGKGIKYLDTVNFNIKHNNLNNYIGNFIFTTPIVDDAFYAKYAQYNTSISIFQYKTTFEEVADVKISKDVNPDLIYPSNYYDNVGNWTENMNVEIYTNIPIPYTAINTVTFNKYILDNRGFNFTEDNCPVITDSAKHIFAKDEDSRISGVFKFGGGYGGFATTETNLFKDITFYNVRYINYSTKTGNYFKNNNIVIKNSFPYISITSNTSSELFLDVDNLVNDNVLGNYIIYNPLHGDLHKIFFNYIENINIEITKNNSRFDYGFLKPYYYYILNSNIDNSIKLNAGDNSNAYFYWTFEGQIVDTKTYELNDCYIECDENSYICNLDQYYIINATVYYNRTMNANNIYGKVNIVLNNYTVHSNTTNYIENKLIHIDLNKVKVNTTETCILFYENLDNETTVKLITKLVDNTSSTSKTIYMYRTQANIIGEENIAAAVAKNYEIAIIEN